MRTVENNTQALQAEIDDLRLRLSESEDTLRAIRNGEVDAVLVSGPDGAQVYTLTGAESPYRFLIEQIHEGALSLNMDGLIFYSNSRFAELTRTPLERVLGHQIREFIHPADHSQFDALVRTLPETGGQAELLLTAADGTPVPVYLSLNRYESMDLDGLCATVTDLTEQKRSEEIVASEKLARSILEQTTEAIVVTNDQGMIIRANRVAWEIAGTNILLRAFGDAFPLQPQPCGEAAGDDNPNPEWTVESIHASALRGQTVQPLEACLTQPGGRKLNLIVGMKLLSGPGDELTGAVITLTDITELKLAQGTIRQSNEELRRANSDLEQFAFSASHDLQQPIRNVAIYSQLLEDRCRGMLDEEAQQYLRFMRAGALQMERLVRDFLDYTRAGAENDLPEAETNGNEVRETVLQNLSEEIRECQARVTADLLPRVRMREVHLEQLFKNLVENAIKYRGERAPEVHVSARKKGGSIMFAVRDNGIGVAPEYHKQIFGIFKRLHSEEMYAGTGIGLAICQRIVERYGGRIWVESELGKGSIFYFSIPL